MKINKIVNPPLYFLLVIMFLLQSCTDKSALLVKTWKLDSWKYGDNVPSPLRKNMDTKIEQMKGNYTATYNSDGTYVTRANNMEIRGTWKLNVNSTKIIATNDKGETNEFPIVELTANRLEFKIKLKNEEITYIMVPAN